MTLAATADFDSQEPMEVWTTEGVQALLLDTKARPSLLVSAVALLAYAAVLTLILTYKASQREVLEEKPLELVLELPAAPTSEPPAEAAPPVETPPPEPPVAEETPPQPEAMQEPPPPPAVEPEPVAPVEPPKPVPPKPQPKKVEAKKPEPKKVEHKPAASAPHPSTPGATSAAGGAPSAGAIPSGYANLVQARIARASANSYPRSAVAAGASGRVPYHIVIGPTGALISKSLTPTGNAAFDSAAAEALSRAAPFPPSGANRPVALSGAIVYRAR